MAESLVYVRTKVRSPRKNQRVRLTVVAAAPSAGGVFNCASSFGEYARTSVRNDRAVFAYSHFPVPQPFEFQTEIISDGTIRDPRFAWDSHHLIYLFYERDALLAIYRVSSDSGLSFGEEFLIGAGRHVDVTAFSDGTLQFSWYEPSTGHLQMSRVAPGEAPFPPPAAFNLVDDGGSNLVAEDDSFRIVQESRSLAWLHWRQLAGVATNLWYSADDAQSFITTAGGVQGIAGGTHPGLTAGPDGMMIAYARVGTSLRATRRFPGDAAWGTVFTVKDAAAADLAIADAASSMAVAYEGSARLVLTTTIAGESTPSDWFSSDQGSSFTRFA